MRKSILPVMADTLDATPRTRRRRSDAQRSIDAIVSGARTLLGRRPDASMEEVATAAGLTRQTVYAHFPVTRCADRRRHQRRESGGPGCRRCRSP